ncbi:Transposable element Tc3 transposase [Araneus ventricosus]|uniref:Transposable element Tc3 transposase n=1 Tax=Araneus ventricosus TaxID=182803 RepID=A0A4Y2BSD9_ARAVE|nr:Transposable element Tc3 transposase [Araneus ventricosus]
MSRPPLAKDHKRLRVEFDKKCITMRKKWDEAIFSDEIKFNLDGPDGLLYFWFDLRKEKEIFSKRTVMVWGGFATEGTTPIVFVQGRMNSDGYVDILADNLLTEAQLITSGDHLLQQGNASVHVSQTSKSWFDANFVKLLEWPEVYKNGIQYQNKEELMSSI